MVLDHFGLRGLRFLHFLEDVFEDFEVLHSQKKVPNGKNFSFGGRVRESGRFRTRKDSKVFKNRYRIFAKFDAVFFKNVVSVSTEDVEGVRQH